MTAGAEMLHRYRYLVADRDRHGNVRVYFRRGRTKIRIREEIGTPAFAKRYEELCGLIPTKPIAAAPHRSETFEGLWEAYRRSTAYPGAWREHPAHPREFGSKRCSTNLSTLVRRKHSEVSESADHARHAGNSTRPQGAGPPRRRERPSEGAAQAIRVGLGETLSERQAAPGLNSGSEPR